MKENKKSNIITDNNQGKYIDISEGLKEVELSKELKKLCENKNPDISVMKKLIEAKANVNYKENDNDWPVFYEVFHWLTETGSTECLETLIENKADVNYKDPRFGSILSKSVDNNLNGNRDNLIKILIDYKANANTPSNMHGDSLLAAAVHTSSPEIVKLLVKNNADINSYSEHYKTISFFPGFLVYNFGQFKSTPSMLDGLKFLLENKLDVNAKIGDEPAITWALEHNDTEIYSILSFYDKDTKINSLESTNPETQKDEVVINLIGTSPEESSEDEIGGVDLLALNENSEEN